MSLKTLARSLALVDLMTHGEFAEGYSLIRDMQGSDFLTALHLLAEPYLGHKNIQHTVRYTELSPTRFKDFWRV